VRKELGSFAVFADLGKLIIGDPDSVHYHDPVSYGAGVGKVFADGTYSAMMYYQAYTRILDGYDPPPAGLARIFLSVFPIHRTLPHGIHRLEQHGPGNWHCGGRGCESIILQKESCEVCTTGIGLEEDGL
jgi:hypothetical protein